MGQKVNPHGLRVGVIKDWDSRWYAGEDKVGDLVVEDHPQKFVFSFTAQDRVSLSEKAAKKLRSSKAKSES